MRGLGKGGGRVGAAGGEKKSPDTSDFTSQPVKEESERAVKPSPSPQAACKVEILPFGKMQGSHSGVRVCVCACGRARMSECVRARAPGRGL